MLRIREEEFICSLPACFGFCWYFQGSFGGSGYHYSSSQLYLKLHMTRISLCSDNQLAVEYHRRKQSCCCLKVKVTQSSPTLCDPMDCSLPGSSVHGNSSGKNTEVGGHALLQGICPTQGSNTGLPHCRQILSQLRHQGSRAAVCIDAKYTRNIAILKGSFCKSKLIRLSIRNPSNPQL